MKQFIHTPRHLTTRRILPGHAHGARFTGSTALPGIDRNEREARRSTWTDRQAARRFQYSVGGSFGFAGALLALAITLLAALGPRPNVLDTTADAARIATVPLVDAAPMPSQPPSVEG